MNPPPKFRVKFFSSTTVCAAMLASGILCAGRATAASGSWSGATDDDWSIAGNWSPGIPGATSGSTSTDIATFYGTPVNTTITVDAGRNVSGIQFVNPTSDIVVGTAGGNALTLTPGGNITFASAAGTSLTESVNAPLTLAGTYTFTNNNTLASENLLSFGGAITSTNTGLTVSGSGATALTGNVNLGTGTLTKSGLGEVTFSGASTAIGRLNITGGQATLENGALTLGTPSNNYAAVGSGATLVIAGGSVNFGASGGNAFGGEGSVLQTGGTVALTGGVLYNQVSYGGVVANYTISGGEFTAGAANSLRGIRNFTVQGNSVVTIDSTIVRISEGTVPGLLTISGNADVTMANALTITGAADGTGGIVLDGGVLTIPGLAFGVSGTSSITFNGGTLRFSAAATISADAQVKTVNVGNGGAVIDTNGNAVNFSRVLSAAGSGGLTKVGSGTLTLGSANAYTGATVVNAGELRAGVGTSAFGNQSAVTLANTTGAVLNLANFSQTVGSLAGGGASGGNVVLGTGTLTLGGNNTNTSYSGTISGSGGLVKVGTGTQTLNGTQSYTGATAVNAGTLLVNGTLGNGGITVGGGVLGGDITAGGTTTISSGGSLEVGNSAGSGHFTTLNLSGSSALSRTEMEFNAGASGANAGTDYDTISIATGLTYGGNLDLVFGGTVGVDTFDLFSFGAVTPVNQFGNVSLYADQTLIGSLTNAGGVWTGTYNLGYGSGAQTFSFDSATGDLVIGVVPEPAAWVLAGLGLTLTLFRRNRQAH